MSILIDENTRVVVQGLTGKEGSFHARQCVAYGTKIVAGVTPGKKGRAVDGIPVYNTVREACREHAINTSLIFVPAPFAADAMVEAADAGLKVIVCITEGVPVLDMMRVLYYLEGRDCHLIGPNCPGVISPDKCKVGIMPGPIHKPGSVGVVSRSGTLTYEVVDQLTKAGLGQSTCVGIGGDPLIGSTFIDILRLFGSDDNTEAVVMIGEIGGTAEEEAARYIKESFSKPVISYIAGRTAPPGKRMGHAGAIISGGQGTAAQKIAALQQCGIHVVENIGEIGKETKAILSH